MRILIATDAFPPKVDGVAETSARIAAMLSERGHVVKVIAPGEPSRDRQSYDIRRVPSVPLPSYPEVRLSTAWGTIVRTAREGWDAAIVLTPGPIGSLTALALPRSTNLVHIYTTDIPRYFEAYRIGRFTGAARGFVRWLANRASATLCPTEHVRAELEAIGARRLVVWGRGVDTERFNPGKRSLGTRWHLTGGEPTRPLVLFVGRLAKEKRVDDIAAAARRLSTLDVRFAIVGDGPERLHLERAFANAPAVFTGFLSGEKLASAFASADVFAFPSISETFGQVVLQAMASGVPPVVVANTAPAELVSPGRTGLFIGERDVAGLAGAVERLIRDVPYRERLGAAATLSAGERSWDCLLDQLEVRLGAPGRVPERSAWWERCAPNGRLDVPS